MRSNIPSWFRFVYGLVLTLPVQIYVMYLLILKPYEPSTFSLTIITIDFIVGISHLYPNAIQNIKNVKEIMDKDK